MPIPHVFQGRSFFGSIFIFQNVAVGLMFFLFEIVCWKINAQLTVLTIAVLFSQPLNTETYNIKLFPV